MDKHPRLFMISPLINMPSAPIYWESSLEKMSLQNNEIHFWLVDLDNSGTPEWEWRKLLNEEEHAISGDPYKDIVLKRTIIEESNVDDVFLVLNQADLSELQ